MSSPKEGVNPLRPYYIPPSIGEQVGALPSQPNPFSHGNVTTTPAAVATTSNKYASRARDIFPDIDYKDHLEDFSPSTVQSIKSLVDELIWKYTSVVMAQPFEVAKTILQVRLQDDVGGLSNSNSSKGLRAPSIPTLTDEPKASPSLISPKNVWEEVR